LANVDAGSIVAILAILEKIKIKQLITQQSSVEILAGLLHTGWIFVDDHCCPEAPTLIFLTILNLNRTN
jgi:hypothetical protein